MPAQPLLRVLTQLRQQILDPDALVRAVASGRRRGTNAEVATGGAEVRRPEGRPPPPGDGVRRPAGAHLEPRARWRRRADAVDALLEQPFGNWHVDTTTQSHQVRVTKKGEALLHTAERAGEVEGTGPRPRQGPAAAGGRPGVRGARALRPRGPDEAEPAGEVPPGRGVPAHPGRLDHRRDGQGPPAPPDRRRAAADGRPRLRQRVPHVRGPAVPHPRPRPARRGDGRGHQAAVDATTTRPSRPGSAWRRTSWSPGSPRST